MTGIIWFISKLKNNLLFVKLILLFFILSKNEFDVQININKFYLEEKKDYFENFINLKSLSSNNNISLIIREKKEILKFFSRILKKNISFADTIYFNSSCNFGNCLVLLNKYIHCCIIIGCKSIILEEKYFWFLKNNNNLKIYNIAIIIDNQKNYNKTSILYINSLILFYIFFHVKPEIKIHSLRNEIIKNLPLINISKEELFVHIRSGDIFTYCPIYPYSQPPLCFYDNIVKNFNFKKIVIISSNMDNPVIQKLINKYSNIFYNKNPLKYDISILIHSSNLVASVSSFLNSIIQLNCELKYLWEYNIYNMKQKIRHYHYDLYKFPLKNFTIYRMEPSSKYKKIMLRWKNSKRQRKLMIKEKCDNFFRVVSL